MYSLGYCAQYRLSDIMYGDTITGIVKGRQHAQTFIQNSELIGGFWFILTNSVVKIFEPDTVYFTLVSVTKASGFTSFQLFKLPNPLTQQPQSCLVPYFSRWIRLMKIKAYELLSHPHYPFLQHCNFPLAADWELCFCWCDSKKNITYLFHSFLAITSVLSKMWRGNKL